MAHYKIEITHYEPGAVTKIWGGQSSEELTLEQSRREITRLAVGFATNRNKKTIGAYEVQSDAYAWAFNPDTRRFATFYRTRELT
jgi:hypothetical protein